MTGPMAIAGLAAGLAQRDQTARDQAQDARGSAGRVPNCLRPEQGLEATHVPPFAREVENLRVACLYAS